MVLGKANPERMNGVNKVVSELAGHQSTQGIKVSIWGITGSLDVNYPSRSYETRLFLRRKNPFALPEGLKEALISKKGNVVFHLHGGWIPVFSTVSKVLAQHGIPFVITPHGAYNTLAMKKNKLIKRIHFRLYEKALLSRARHIHCIGQSEVTGTNGLFPNSKTVLIPYGFTPAGNTADVKPQNESVVFGFVGRLDVHTKGIDLLLKAFANVLKSSSDARLWLVGDGADRVQVEQMIEQLKLQHKVVLWGGRYGEEKNKLLTQMNVFVHPSRNEGLPASVLEALSFGIPCVVTTATNVAEEVAKYHCGIAIPDDDVPALTAAMLNMAQEVSSTSQVSYRWAADKLLDEVYQWSRVLQRMNEQLYSA